MKPFSFLKSALLISCFALVIGCQKETGGISSTQDESMATKSQNSEKQVTRAFNDSFDIELGFSPDIQGGWTMADPDAPAWYPGTGKGNATHMGNVNLYLNDHTVRIGGIVTVFKAPVNQFFAAQLPFVIPNDVSMVIYDDKGNSVWFLIAPEGLPTTHLTATRISSDGKVLIVGGTGKFEGATGETAFHLEFDQASYNSGIFKDASMRQHGWIRY